MAKLIMCRLDEEIKDISPNDLAGDKYLFKFSIVPKEKFDIRYQDSEPQRLKIIMGARKKESLLIKNIKLKENQNLLKVLYEYSKSILVDRLKQGISKVDEEITLKDISKILSYDPNNINMKIGEWFEIEIPTKIGFK